ncbi:MAG: acetate--CoA ligase [Candidatus Thorarchaeota archaeon]
MSEEKITVISTEGRKFDPPKSFIDKAFVKSAEERRKLWEESVENPDAFWLKTAKEICYWKKEPTIGFEWPDPKGAVFRWFADGITNMAYNCTDKWVDAGRGDQDALLWQGEPEEDTVRYTYKELRDEVNKAANVLKSFGVGKGDRVAIYLPMIPELAVVMLACTRIGAVHSIVFGAFGAEALKERIVDCEAKVLVTADGSFRRGKVFPLKLNADAALEETPSIEKVLVVQRTKMDVAWDEGRDVWYHDEMANANVQCETEWMNAEDPLFILYTSGSTGKPKGVLHTLGGYMVYAAHWHEGDVYWCTADIGWITGHSYIVYGPLSAGSTTLMFEGVPNFPDNDRFWQVVEKYKVNQFYTAPTAIRALMKFGDDPVLGRDLSSLNLLGTVGEPINPEAWMWYHSVVGKEQCPIVDTYWQTETGGVIMTPLPGATPTKPGSTTLPYFGIDPIIVDKSGDPVGDNEGGYLCIKKPWPGLMRTVYGDHERFIQTYWVQYKDPETGDPMYMTGDGSRRDEDGYFWVMGRLDDVLKVSGHRLGTAEIESALVAHDTVAESAVVGFPHAIKGEDAVVGFPHAIKGEDIYVFVTLKEGVEETEDLKQLLRKHVRQQIGPIATPAKIQFAEVLPKTRSGKIMRRILKGIAAGHVKDLGDTTTLADPSVVDNLIEKRVE